MQNWSLLTGKNLLFFATLLVLVCALYAGTQIIEAQPISPTTKEFKLFMNGYGYNATKGGPTMTVNQGDKIKITLIGNDTRNHDWTLDSNSPSPYNVKSQRAQNQATTTVEFEATTAGTFKYYCDIAAPGVPSHRERGSEGNLIVLVAPAAPQPAPPVPQAPPAAPAPPPPAPAAPPQQPAPVPQPAPQPQQPAPAPAPAPAPVIARPETPKAPPEQPTQAGIDPTIAALIGGIVVVGVLVVVLRTRKRTTNS